MSLYPVADDVIIATGAKSGTNWMLYCAHQVSLADSERVLELPTFIRLVLGRVSNKCFASTLASASSLPPAFER